MGEKNHCIVTDFIKVFGERRNQFSHNEPVLDDDSWERVDRVTEILDKRFAQWTGVEVLTIEEFISRQLKSGQPLKEIASDCAQKFEIEPSEAFRLALALKSKSGGK